MGEDIRKIRIPVVNLSHTAAHFFFFASCSSVSMVSSAIFVPSFRFGVIFW